MLLPPFYCYKPHQYVTPRDPLPAIHHVLLLHPGMKLACMVAFPPEILTRAKELIPILSANLKVYTIQFACVQREKKERRMTVIVV